MDPKQMLAFALDAPDLPSALAVLDLVAPEVGVVKVGLELFVREGPRAVKAVQDRGSRVFLDLKLHDIPQTVEGAARSAAALGVDLLTVHAAGGAQMLGRACSATAGTRTRVVAVTVLTSLGPESMGSIGLSLAPSEWVDRLTSLAVGAGCAGVVCSPQEVASVRAHFPGAFLVTPGIRPDRGPSQDDQARTATPEAAIRGGADLLVVGRPIRMAKDPAAEARAIVARIGQALLSPGAQGQR